MAMSGVLRWLRLSAGAVRLPTEDALPDDQRVVDHALLLQQPLSRAGAHQKLRSDTAQQPGICGNVGRARLEVLTAG